MVLSEFARKRRVGRETEESNDARPDSHVLTVGVRTSQAKCFMMMRRRLSLAKITAREREAAVGKAVKPF